MKVDLYSHSVVANPEVHSGNGFVREALVSDLDVIAEFAGRACYQAFNKPNPATRSNRDYLRNVIGLGHESVLEHGSVTFYVTGASRNLLLELERHRHLSLSVLSTRYAPPEKYGNVIHPDVPADWRAAVENLDAQARKLEGYIYADLVERGVKPKEARTASRSVMLGCSETKFVVTGNLRAWRYVIKLRGDKAADTEIRHFAGLVLRQLLRIAPNAMFDFDDRI